MRCGPRARGRGRRRSSRGRTGPSSGRGARGCGRGELRVSPAVLSRQPGAMARATTARFDEASWLRLEPAPGETLRAALERTLRAAIRERSLRTGARLPSSRRLAAQVGVSRGVASDVYAQLEAQGFVVMRPRSAPVVAATAPKIAQSSRWASADSWQPRYDLTPTTPNVTLVPLRQWLPALQHPAARAPARVLDYGDQRGDAGLRETIADHLGRTRGVVAEPGQIILVQGTAQALHILLRVLARRGQRRVAIEDPSLDGQHDRIEALGMQIVGCAVDDEGIAVEGVKADAALVTPAHQFPTGVVLSGGRRRALLSWSRERERLVIEDDYDAEFRYDREPVRALQGLDPERVAYAGTVSKTLAPALRHPRRAAVAVPARARDVRPRHRLRPAARGGGRAGGCRAGRGRQAPLQRHRRAARRSADYGWGQTPAVIDDVPKL